MIYKKKLKNRTRELLPAVIASTIPSLESTRHEKDPVAKVKWFTPDSSWTWYVVEYDSAKRLCYGLVIGLERELGFFSLTEIEKVLGPWGMAVERDQFFDPTPISKCH
jgi:hypothetical protein